MIRRFLAALQFLTVFPVRGSTAKPGEAALFFPLVGALAGASAGAVFAGASVGFGRSIAGLLAIAWLLAVTGGLHEDGLADVADALRAGRSRENMILILRDSRIGAYGALALVMSVLLRWQAVSQGSGNPIAAFAAALALSRSSMVVLAATAPAAGDGLGAAFARELSKPVLFAVAGQAVLLAVLAGPVSAPALVLATALTISLAKGWFLRRLGGVNGDCLGATCQAVETVNLLVLAWRHSS